jgi:ABC-type molybdate transport system substrate-binding protein
MPVVSTSAGNGVAFLIGVTAMSDIIAKACSSPQTAELNADRRAETLMKWVTVGMVEGVAIVAIAASIDKQHAMAILAGGALEAVITYFEYQYAKKSGLASPEPGTEDYEGTNYAV